MCAAVDVPIGISRQAAERGFLLSWCRGRTVLDLMEGGFDSPFLSALPIA